MNDELMDLYPRGCSVNITRRIGDVFAHDFTGTVIGYYSGYVIVSDQDGDCWDCEPDQIKFNSDEYCN